MNDLNYGELVNKKPHIHSTVSNYTEPLDRTDGVCTPIVLDDSTCLPNKNNDLKKQLSNVQDQLDCAMGILEQFKRERDEAREVASGLAQQAERLRNERDEAREQLHIAVGLLSTQPQFADKHPEDVLVFVKEGTK